MFSPYPKSLRKRQTAFQPRAYPDQDQKTHLMGIPALPLASFAITSERSSSTSQSSAKYSPSATTKAVVEQYTLKQ